MNLEFVINDYVLIWYLLFQASISESIHKLKQKLWLTYKNEYNNIYREKGLMLHDVKNYIPSNDTVYNIVIESKEYAKIKRLTEKYRTELLKTWNRKVIKDFEQIVRKKIRTYTVYVVDSHIDILELPRFRTQNIPIAIFGKKLSKEDANKSFTYLIIKIMQKEFSSDYENIDKLISNAIIDMAINGELTTRQTKTSHYFTNSNNLIDIERQLYPYWLMYLGIPKEEMSKYMFRDKIAFDPEKYPNNNFDKMNLEDFIRYCIANKDKMIKVEHLELI